jgi:hypothetical protein
MVNNGNRKSIQKKNIYQLITYKLNENIIDNLYTYITINYFLLHSSVIHKNCEFHRKDKKRILYSILNVKNIMNIFVLINKFHISFISNTFTRFHRNLFYFLIVFANDSKSLLFFGTFNYELKYVFNEFCIIHYYIQVLVSYITFLIFILKCNRFMYTILRKCYKD